MFDGASVLTQDDKNRVSSPGPAAPIKDDETVIYSFSGFPLLGKLDLFAPGIPRKKKQDCSYLCYFDAILTKHCIVKSHETTLTNSSAEKSLLILISSSSLSEVLVHTLVFQRRIVYLVPHTLFQKSSASCPSRASRHV